MAILGPSRPRSFYAFVQGRIDFGRGQAADVLGQPGAIYRLNSASSGTWIDPANQIFQNYPVLRKVLRSDPGLESTTIMSTMFYNLIADLTPLELGDIWIQTDPYYGKGDTLVDYSTSQFDGICIASHGPVKKAFGARLDRMLTVYRPAEATDSNGYYNTTLPAAQPLVLKNGIFNLGVPGDTPVQIPGGFMVRARPFGAPQFGGDIPGIPRYAEWYVYVPPLEGFTFRQGDRIMTYEGSRFIVVNPWHQEAGFVGSQMSLEYEIDRAA